MIVQKSFTLVLAGLMSLAACAENAEFAALKAKADHDESQLSPQGHEALTASVYGIAKPTFENCPGSDLADRHPPFTVIMQLDATGKVVTTWRTGDSAIAKCLDATMRKATLFRPPHAPFYTSFEYTWAGG